MSEVAAVTSATGVADLAHGRRLLICAHFGPFLFPGGERVIRYNNLARAHAQFIGAVACIAQLLVEGAADAEALAELRDGHALLHRLVHRHP